MNLLTLIGALCLFSLFVIGAFSDRVTGLTCNTIPAPTLRNEE